MRTQILDAARELFASRGYEAVTMREIGKRIEYSATALYGHFADKETLVRELCRQDFSDFAQHFLAGVAGSTDPVERMCRAGLVYLGFAQRYPQHYRVMFMMPMPKTPPEGEEREDPTHNAYVFLCSLVDDLLAADLLRPGLGDRDLIAQTIWAMVHGAAALDLTLDKSADWLDFRPRRERFAAALQTLLRALLRTPDAAEDTLRRAIGASPFLGDVGEKRRPRTKKAKH